MKIARIHNYYQQAGGEDSVLASEMELLQSRGQLISTFFLHNDAVDSMGRLTLAAKTLWNRDTYRRLRTFFRQHRPEVAHFDNTFPLISPSAYYAAHAEGVAVVQTLHNYRLLCVNAMLYRQGSACEECVGKSIPWPGVWHGCYRDDRKASAVVAAMLTLHRALGTWRREVDTYIALTDFARGRYIAGGLPASKIVVKPNFLEMDPDPGTGTGNFALFVGRLTPEKGVDTLLRAWALPDMPMPLKIIGTGPLESRVRQAAEKNTMIEYLGRQPLTQVMQLMGDAACLVFPSTWYEGLPRTIVESFAKATPVVASRLGAMKELIEEGCSGALFTPDDAADLAGVMRRLASTAALPAMRPGARQAYQARFTADRAYAALMAIYQNAIAKRAEGLRGVK
ncbi:MAG: glycosyltransferase [Phycisphaerales bacterium]|nr:glycosyltransferase [Phycisphaerales bacterium]